MGGTKFWNKNLSVPMYSNFLEHILFEILFIIYNLLLTSKVNYNKSKWNH